MTPFARKFFIAALVYLLLGLLAQLVTLFDLWLGFNPLAYTASAATQQILLLGWLTQLGLALIYERLETLCPCGIGDYEAANQAKESTQNLKSIKGTQSEIVNRKSKIVNRKSKIENPNLSFDKFLTLKTELS